MRSNTKILSICFIFLQILFIISFAGTVSANDLSVSNVVLTTRNTATHTYDIRFDISWNNSWFIAGAPSADANWDAAWVFAKYATWDGSAWKDWQHCKLLNTGYTAPSGSQMDFASTGAVYAGLFMHRNSAGAGTVNWTNASVRWDYGADGVSDSTPVKVKVFGIEMVYIPQGSFYAGTGSTAETNAFFRSGTTEAYYVTSEAAMPVATAGNLDYSNTNTFGGDRTGPIPLAFPKGFNAFYLMKYEISQGQYADFLNSLTSTQAGNRYNAAYIGSFRFTIAGTYPNLAATRPDRACNYLSVADISAYADWAGLRPYTELEFEKACRGPISPVANEYAWGTANVTAAATISGAEDGTETITTANANCRYNGVSMTGGDGGNGPLRVGVFATEASAREPSGAGYYGNLDLSGSLWERPVTVGQSTGRSFTGSHGDGTLAADGTATNSDWPGAAGIGWRGGKYDGSGSAQLRTSDRSSAVNSDANRYSNVGGRLARTAP